MKISTCRMELDSSGAGISAYLKLLRDAENADFLELAESVGIGSPLSADTVSDIAEEIRVSLGL